MKQQQTPEVWKERSDDRGKRVGLVVALIITILCIAIIGGVTVAMLTYREEIGGVVDTGELNATVTRTGYGATLLGEDGYLAEVGKTEDDTPANDIGNAFGLEQGDRIVPGSELWASFEIANDETGKGVAFGWWVELVVTDEDGTNAQTLASQLTLTMTVRDTETQLTEKKLSDDGLTLGSAEEFAGKLTPGEKATFTVTVTFDNTQDNNEVQDSTLYFNLIIHAVQITTK